MGRGIPLPHQGVFGFWGFKVSDLVHTFGGFVGILSHAHQGVFARGGGESVEALTVSANGVSKIPKTGVKRGYLNHDEDKKNELNTNLGCAN